MYSVVNLSSFNPSFIYLCLLWSYLLFLIFDAHLNCTEVFQNYDIEVLIPNAKRTFIHNFFLKIEEDMSYLDFGLSDSISEGKLFIHNITLPYLQLILKMNYI